MKPIDRRTFLAASTAAAFMSAVGSPESREREEREEPTGAPAATLGGANAVVDFRYSPEDFQSTICFPDDPVKNPVAHVERLALADWQFVNFGDGQRLGSIDVTGTPFLIPLIRRARICTKELNAVATFIHLFAPGIRCEQIEPIFEAVSDRRLQSVVALGSKV